MKYTFIFPIAFFSLIILSIGCRQTVNFLDVPIEGNVAGTVYDSLTKKPVSGAIVSATFTLPDGTTGTQTTRTVTTTMDGSFFIKDVWDELLITVNKSGFEDLSFTRSVDIDSDNTHLNIPLKGFPVVFGEFIRDLSLDFEANDTTSLTFELRDIFNENPGPATASVFFYEIESDLNVAAKDLDVLFDSQSFTTFTTQVTADMFPDPKGSPVEYGYYYEYTDPDGNTLDYGLAEEEILDTLTIF